MPVDGWVQSSQGRQHTHKTTLPGHDTAQNKETQARSVLARSRRHVHDTTLSFVDVRFIAYKKNPDNNNNNVQRARQPIQHNHEATLPDHDNTQPSKHANLPGAAQRA